jgi:hypothetical protein
MVFKALDTSPCPPIERDILVVADELSPFQQEIAGRLQKRLMSTTASRCDILPLQNASKVENLQSVFCISILELGVPLLRDLEPKTYGNPQTLLTTAQHLLWVSSQSKNGDDLSIGVVDGLARVLRTENPGHAFVTLYLKSNANVGATVHYMECIMKTVTATTHRTTDGTYEREYVEENGMIKIGRLVKARYLDHHLSTQESPSQSQVQAFGLEPHLALYVIYPGLLDTLHFTTDE